MSLVAPPTLGPLRRRVEANPLVAWLVFSFGCVILLGWAVLASLFAVDQLGRPAPSRGTIIFGLVMITLFFFPIGAIFARKGWTGRLHRFDLHDGGVAWEDHGGRVAYGWHEVRGVHWEELQHEAEIGLGIGVKTHATAKLTIVPFRGGQITVDEKLPDHVALAAHVRDVAAEALLPRYEAELAAARRVTFGTIGLDGSGIHLERAFYPWDMIGAVQWESSGASAWYAIYNVHGQRVATVATAGVLDAVVLEAFLERFGKLRTAAEATSFGAQLTASARRLVAKMRG
jgi:hypothetical protein